MNRATYTESIILSPCYVINNTTSRESSYYEGSACEDTLSEVMKHSIIIYSDALEHDEIFVIGPISY
ncbi:MAG: hypothetical protein FD123_364 [Bacteroidetes bacterium]|nr:MAG: hypothetical protein FD123_364 [Bacteroidota bacterium]